MHTAILPGTLIGKNTIICPGATLTGIVPSDSFIRPQSYGHSISPIKDKLNVRTEKVIRNFIINCFSSIVGEKIIKDEELFLSKNISEVLVFADARIKYWQEGFQKNPQEKEIIVGYNLPEEVTADKNLSWFDFSNYEYRSNSVNTRSLAQKLFLNYELMFIEKDSG